MLWETGSSVPGLLSHTYFWETKRNGSLQDTILLGEHKRWNYVAQDWNWHERPNILDPLLNSSWKQRNLQFSYWDWVLSIRKLTPGSCMHRWRNTNGEHLVAGGRNKKNSTKKNKNGKTHQGCARYSWGDEFFRSREVMFQHGRVKESSRILFSFLDNE